MAMVAMEQILTSRDQSSELPNWDPGIASEEVASEWTALFQVKLAQEGKSGGRWKEQRWKEQRWKAAELLGVLPVQEFDIHTMWAAG